MSQVRMQNPHRGEAFIQSLRVKKVPRANIVTPKKWKTAEEADP